MHSQESHSLRTVGARYGSGKVLVRYPCTRYTLYIDTLRTTGPFDENRANKQGQRFSSAFDGHGLRYRYPWYVYVVFNLSYIQYDTHVVGVTLVWKPSR